MNSPTLNTHNASLPLMLKQLHLASIKTHWQAMAQKAITEHWAPDQYLAELCHIELLAREDKRLQQYLKDASLPVGKQLGSFDFSVLQGVTPVQVNQLIQQNGWVKTGGNLLVFGASGVGKTHLVSSIGYGLAEAGIRVKFMAATALVQLLQRAKAELKLTEALNRLDKYAVLIVDDIGYVRKTEQESSVLFELIAHRYERHSLIITSNQSFEDWDKLFDDTVMTVAAIDRLIHHATIIQCEGGSYRRKSSMQKQ
ncbi:MAG: IS21-like element helper ATPase IstB [Methylotenera sp.]|jgi:DNA replication protein DnaC|uniref:IS21-like element helper ATPase IstB n=1 Tax=Methylotenera sp. TaxID=2051956 RepID=UPI002725DAE3|nr:IS21-like element helper ATPase IstB [Methylotenera sp.]MDO9393821.1 IS21-like element helper ATPase IstB [Methylotenera sp.]MDP2071959.1 IS21-like element helper ATPase IstB [Methylotenera sp.]